MSVHTAIIPGTGDSWAVARHGGLVLKNGRPVKPVDGKFEVDHPDAGPYEAWLADYDELRSASFGRPIGQGCTIRDDLDVVFGPDGERLPIVMQQTGWAKVDDAKAVRMPDGEIWLIADLKKRPPDPGHGFDGDDGADDDDTDDTDRDDEGRPGWLFRESTPAPPPPKQPMPRRMRKLGDPDDEPEEPVKTNPKAKLTWEKVEQIRALRAAGATQQALADEYDVSRSVIGRIIRNETWKVAT